MAYFKLTSKRYEVFTVEPFVKADHAVALKFTHSF